MSLSDAMSDLKAEVMNGRSSAEVYAEIAAEYGINPQLLIRKFNESYTNDEAVRATMISVDPRVNLDARIQNSIAKACKRYDVAIENTFEREVRGQKYTLICRLTNVRVRPFVAVSHKDGLAYRLA